MYVCVGEDVRGKEQCIDELICECVNARAESCETTDWGGSPDLQGWYALIVVNSIEGSLSDQTY